MMRRRAGKEVEEEEEEAQQRRYRHHSQLSRHKMASRSRSPSHWPKGPMLFCPDCEMYLNGYGQWEDHIRAMKHRVNQRPLLTVADAEARAAKTRRLWAEWEERRQEEETQSRLRAELEVQMGADAKGWRWRLQRRSRTLRWRWR